MTQLINATAARMVRADNNPFASAGDWSGWWTDHQLNLWDNGVLWPSSQMLGGAVLATPPMYAPAPKFFGNQAMKKFSGITRDSTGVALAAGVVKAFLTTGDQFLRQVTSDAGGYFDLPSEYSSSNHYLLAYKAGSPDVAGATVNTLQPT